MKRKVLSILGIAVCIIPLFACVKNNNHSTESGNKEESQISNQKTLVVYFSCTNNTRGIADHIIKILDAAEFRIVPSEPYTTADLNYNDTNCRANQEQNNDAARPAIVNSISTIADYEVIYIGYPIWWGKLPKIMYTFFETYDLNGKIIIPFCTSGGSGISTSINEIRSLVPHATIKNGNRFPAGASESNIRSWIEDVQPTNISSVKMDDNKNLLMYNLQGQTVDTKSAKGIVITNAKKYLIVEQHR